MARFRLFACSVVPCEPAGCGAPAGERCRAYRHSWHGPARGTPVAEVHAARRDAFRAWLASRVAARLEEGP